MAKVNLEAPFRSITGRLGKEGDAPSIYSLEGRTVLRYPSQETPKNTIRKSACQAALKKAAKAYRLLTFEQATDWRNYIRAMEDRSEGSVRIPKKLHAAFSQVNLHRVLAGETLLMEAPEASNRTLPVAEPQVQWVSSRRLRLVFDHPYGAGFAVWHYRVTPPLKSQIRLANEREARTPLADTRTSYINSSAFSEAIEVDTEDAYQIGDTLGLKLLVLTSDFVPGESRFYRRLVVEG